MFLRQLCADVDSDNAAAEAIEAHVTPASLLHDVLQCGGVGKGCERVGQVVIFLERFAEDRAEQRR